MHSPQVMCDHMALTLLQVFINKQSWIQLNRMCETDDFIKAKGVEP